MVADFEDIIKDVKGKDAKDLCREVVDCFANERKAVDLPKCVNQPLVVLENVRLAFCPVEFNNIFTFF